MALQKLLSLFCVPVFALVIASCGGSSGGGGSDAGSSTSGASPSTEGGAVSSLAIEDIATLAGEAGITWVSINNHAENLQHYPAGTVRIKEWIILQYNDSGDTMGTTHYFKDDGSGTFSVHINNTITSFNIVGDRILMYFLAGFIATLDTSNVIRDTNGKITSFDAVDDGGLAYSYIRK